MTLEFLPFVMWLLSAGEGVYSLQRAVSSLDILSNREKLAFEEHVFRLCQLGLTYVRSEEHSNGVGNGYGRLSSWEHQGGSRMRLEPEIDQITCFQQPGDQDDTKVMLWKEVPSALKELLAHGVSLRKLKLKENISEKEHGHNSSVKIPEMNLHEPDSFSSKSDSVEITTVTTKPNGKRKQSLYDFKVKLAKTSFLGIGAAKAKAAKAARKAAQIGYDRSKKTKMSNTGSGVPLNQVMRFKYKQGFTQAVRIPCRIDDLL